jgi:hypothetical protein
LLKESMNLNIYQYINFDENPKDYCGLKIKTNPL